MTIDRLLPDPEPRICGALTSYDTAPASTPCSYPPLSETFGAPHYDIIDAPLLHLVDRAISPHP